MDSRLSISEIFFSLQGESTFAVQPCIFVRLAGCNLRCNYCDASYSWEGEKDLNVKEVLDLVEGYPCSLVEVTGGEPLHQKEGLTALLKGLLAAKKQVLLETNGSYTLVDIPLEVTAIVDVKCPDSGSAQSFSPANLELIRRRSLASPGSCELKFVLSSRRDYLWAKDFVEENGLSQLLPVLFSPVLSRLSGETLAAWLLEDGLPVRLQLQLHTILWPTVTRGV